MVGLVRWWPDINAVSGWPEMVGVPAAAVPSASQKLELDGGSIGH